MAKDLIKSIIKSLSSGKKELLIQDFEFKNKRNELLFFFKPECFLVENVYTEHIIEMVLQKFEYKVDISGILLLRGERLEELRIMDRHYGFINKLSREASQMLSDTDILEIQENLKIPDIKRYKLLGGHEFLNQFKEFNEDSLNELWLTRKSVKLRSGFYIQKYVVTGEDIVLINGFHPMQLRHYTHPAHTIILLLLHSDEDWKKLRNDVVGATFPDKAERGSIRNEIFQNKHKYGFREVSISNNCVHLSAGPFEALFEINNFLKDVKIVDFKLEKTNMFRKMSERKIGKKDIEKSLKNPVARINNIERELFTFTEEKDSWEAIYEYSKYFI